MKFRVLGLLTGKSFWIITVVPKIPLGDEFRPDRGFRFGVRHSHQIGPTFFREAWTDSAGVVFAAYLEVSAGVWRSGVSYPFAGFSATERTRKRHNKTVDRIAHKWVVSGWGR